MFASLFFFYVGKLHRHIVALQVSEGTAVRKLEDAKKKILKLEAQLYRAEQRIDNRDSAIYHNRLESRSKTKHLKHTIQVNHFIKQGCNFSADPQISEFMLNIFSEHV